MAFSLGNQLLGKRLLATLGASTLGVVTLLSCAAAWGQPRRVGVWLTNSPSPLYYDNARIDQAVAELAEAGFNTLYPNVWSRGSTFHRSDFAPIEPALALAQSQAQASSGFKGLDPICRMTAAAHRRGMQVIPWFEY